MEKKFCKAKNFKKVLNWIQKKKIYLTVKKKNILKRKNKMKITVNWFCLILCIKINKNFGKKEIILFV
jgi:hypothetical protein